MTTLRIITTISFCFILNNVKAQLPPNYLGLSADSISHLAKKQNYKLRDTYIINDSVFEVEYFTDFDGNVGKNSIGNSMLRCVYTFSYSKDKNNCIECKYGFIIEKDLSYVKQLLNHNSLYIKDGTFKTEWGWNSIDDKSYAYIEKETDMGERFNIVYELRPQN
jgi:hypothetical protein